jgi:uncharacterized SAM-binding protein YcdF (DUF218 family)
MKPPDRRAAALTVVSDAVSAWWRQWRRPLLRFSDLCYRLFLIIGYAWVGIRIELPLVAEYLPLKNVLIVLAAVIMIGKTIYDTLFYDHFKP